MQPPDHEPARQTIVHPWTAIFDRATLGVPAIAPAAAFLYDLFGGDLSSEIETSFGDRSYRAVRLRLPNAAIELIETPAAGIHHLTWSIDDLDALAADLEARGSRTQRGRRDGTLDWLLLDPAEFVGVSVLLRRRSGEQTAALPARSRLHHIAIAAPDGPAALEAFRRILGGGFIGPTSWGSFDAVTIDQAIPYLGFISPSPSDVERRGLVARFLDERGPGPHHLAFDLADLDQALAAAARSQIRLVNPSPPEGPVRDVFLHPSNPTGALLRLTLHAKRRQDLARDET